MTNRKVATWFEAFTRIAEEHDYSWTLRRQSGWTVSGEHSTDEEGNFIPIEQIPEEHRKRLSGYQIQVNHTGFSRDGEEVAYTTLENAVTAGMQLIVLLLEEEE